MTSGPRPGPGFRLDPAALARHRRLNRLQSVLLLAGLAALAGLTGAVVAGTQGMVFAAAAATLFLLLDPAPGSALFRNAFGALPLTPRQAPELHELVAVLARRAGLPRMPSLHLIPSPVLQAMASGSREAPALALTLGLLESLPPRELAGVLAHEIAHLRHGDMRVMRLATAAAMLTRSAGALGTVLLLLWLPARLAMAEPPSPILLLLLIAAPTAGDLMVLSLSRQREFQADDGAVALTGDPAGLAAALARLEELQGDDWERLARRGGAGWLRWLRTHPTIGERIARLAETLVPAEPPPLPWPATGRPAWPAPPRAALGQRLARHWLL